MEEMTLERATLESEAKMLIEKLTNDQARELRENIAQIIENAERAKANTDAVRAAERGLHHDQKAG